MMILIALGANLPTTDGTGPLETCIWAANELRNRRGLTFISASRPYRSDPVPPSGQPTYVNAAMAMQSDLPPHEILKMLHEVEDRAGRVRSVPNAARPLDLDLIAVGDQVIGDSGLVLPHPRMHLRRFVLMPLMEVAPDWLHPVLGATVTALLDRLPPDDTRILLPPGVEILAAGGS